MRFKKTTHNSILVYSSSKSRAPLLCTITPLTPAANSEDEYRFDWNTSEDGVRKAVLNEWGNRRNKRKNIPHITIYCEGQTEFHYLTELAKILGLSEHIYIFPYNGGDPKIQFTPAVNNFLWQKQFKPDFNEELWFVFDKDSHTGYCELTAMPQINSNGIFLAWSNPCIEYWFLSHSRTFQDEQLPRTRDELIEKKEWKEEDKEQYSVSHFTKTKYRKLVSPDDCLKALKTLFPEYSKSSSTIFYRFSKELAFALKNCKNQQDPSQHGSAVPSLIERLIHYSEYSKKEALKRLTEAKPDESVAAPVEQIVPKWSVADFNRFKSLAGSLQNSASLSPDNSKFMFVFLSKITKCLAEKSSPDIVKTYLPD